MYFSKLTVLLLLLSKGELGSLLITDMRHKLQKWSMQFFTTCSSHGQGETICCKQSIHVLDIMLLEKLFTHTLKMIN